MKIRQKKKKNGVVTVTCLEKNGSAAPDNTFFFSIKTSTLAVITLHQHKFVFIKEAKIIDYLGKLCNSFYFTL